MVENGNIEEFSKRLEYLIQNPRIRINMGQKACENIKRLDIRCIATQWQNLFNELLSE